MGELMLAGCILSPFLLGLGAAGWLAGRKARRRGRPRLGQYPPPRRRGTDYGGGLDGSITREEDIA